MQKNITILNRLSDLFKKLIELDFIDNETKMILHKRNEKTSYFAGEYHTKKAINNKQTMIFKLKKDNVLFAVSFDELYDINLAKINVSFKVLSDNNNKNGLILYGSKINFYEFKDQLKLFIQNININQNKYELANVIKEVFSIDIPFSNRDHYIMIDLYKRDKNEQESQSLFLNFYLDQKIKNYSDFLNNAKSKIDIGLLELSKEEDFKKIEDEIVLLENRIKDLKKILNNKNENKKNEIRKDIPNIDEISKELETLNKIKMLSDPSSYRYSKTAAMKILENDLKINLDNIYIDLEKELLNDQLTTGSNNNTIKIKRI